VRIEKLSIGVRLREERTRIGLVQADAAKAAGVGFSTYQGYERGERFPDAETLQRLSMQGFDVLYIVTGKRDCSDLSGGQAAALEAYSQIDDSLQHMAVAILQTMANSSN